MANLAFRAKVGGHVVRRRTGDGLIEIVGMTCVTAVGNAGMVKGRNCPAKGCMAHIARCWVLPSLMIPYCGRAIIMTPLAIQG